MANCGRSALHPCDNPSSRFSHTESEPPTYIHKTGQTRSLTGKNKQATNTKGVRLYTLHMKQIVHEPGKGHEMSAGVGVSYSVERAATV